MYKTVSCPIPGHEEEEEEGSAQLSSAMESLIIIFADLRTKSHSINLYLKLNGTWKLGP